MQKRVLSDTHFLRKPEAVSDNEKPVNWQQSITVYPNSRQY